MLFCLLVVCASGILFPLEGEGPWRFSAYELIPPANNYSQLFYLDEFVDAGITSISSIEIELDKIKDHSKLCQIQLIDCLVVYDHLERQGVITGSGCGRFLGVKVGYFFKNNNTIRVYFALA